MASAPPAQHVILDSPNPLPVLTQNPLPVTVPNPLPVSVPNPLPVSLNGAISVNVSSTVTVKPESGRTFSFQSATVQLPVAAGQDAVANMVTQLNTLGKQGYQLVGFGEIPLLGMMVAILQKEG